MLFSLPVLALVGALLLYPIGQTVYYSFTQWDGLTSTWVGTSTYSRLLNSPDFQQVLKNNAMLLLAVPVAIGIPLAVAFLLSSHLPGWRFFRTVFFLPTAVSWVVIGAIAARFFADEGILQRLLGSAGLGSLHPNMLSHPRSALAAVAITFIWGMFGTNLIIFLAGMSTIDVSLYEAAKVDGAGQFRVLFSITLPLLRRFVQFAFIITLVSAFTAIFSLIYIMTAGGPGFATTTLEFYGYQQGFATGDFGTAATAGVLLFVAVAVVSVVQVRLFRGSGE
ncbi:MAG: raffinose/stachyose/melibiose transport system permease protein [Gaiellales bacterium]|nr:raffinose/stachyose/melibiose transport system permease protein [Gaiellales bacterium]